MIRFNFSFCIACEVVIASAIAVLTALGQPSLVSLLFAVSFILAFGYAAFYFNKDPNISKVAILIGLCFFNVFLEGVLDGGMLSFNYFKKVIMFLAFVLLVYFASEHGWTISARVAKMIGILPVLAGVFLIISYYFLGNTELKAWGITLGFSNPNFTGMWLLHFFLYDCLFIAQVWNGKSKWRLLCVPIAVITWNMILLTRARSCMIGVVSFFVLIVLGLRNKRANKTAIAVIALLPIVYAVLYLQIVDKAWFNNLFGFMVSKGKNLTSRVYIWKVAFKALKRHPILGSYAGISHGTGFSQMHNTHVDVLASYGIIPFILFVRILYDSMVKINKQDLNFFQYAAFCAFCAVIIMGSFEASLVAAAMGMNLLTVGFLVLACYESDSEPIRRQNIGSGYRCVR